MSPTVGETGQPAPDDASIPVLTERLTLPPLELDTTLPKEVAEEPAPPITPPAPAPAPLPLPAARPLAPAPAVAAGTHWTRIELELRASILRGIAEALPQEVDAMVRSRMSEAIDKLVAQLAAETRLAIAASLRDIVDHAVRAELERLRRRR